MRSVGNSKGKGSAMRVVSVCFVSLAAACTTAPLWAQESRSPKEYDAASVAAILYARPRLTADTRMLDTASRRGIPVDLPEVARRIGAHVGSLTATLSCGATPDTCHLAEQRVLVIDSVVVRGKRATVVLRFLSRTTSTFQPVALLIRTLFLAKRHGVWSVVREGRVGVSSREPSGTSNTRPGGLTNAEAVERSLLIGGSCAATLLETLAA